MASKIKFYLFIYFLIPQIHSLLEASDAKQTSNNIQCPRTKQ